MVDKALFGSKTDEWATPEAVFNELNAEFCFDLDPCADNTNHKCQEYFTVKENGLSQNWGGGVFSAIHRIVI